MPQEPTITAGQTPAAPALTNVAPAIESKPVGGLENNGEVAASVTPTDDPAGQTPKTPLVPDKPVVPERYELKLSEGSRLTPEHLEHVATYAKSKGMTQEQAAELLTREEGLAKNIFDTQQARYEQTVETWKQASMNDPEIGGDKFGQNVELAKRALGKFGGESFSKMLDETGYGNHPEVLRVFARIGKAMAEDKMIPAGNSGGGTVSLEEKFYGKTSK